VEVERVETGEAAGQGFFNVMRAEEFKSLPMRFPQWKFKCVRPKWM
jgi:hypothetical protein